MLKAVIFDFNGVIVDDEYLHFLVFQKVLREERIDFTEQEYFGTYLGLDDKGCFAAVLSDRGRPRKPSEILDLVERKATYYLEELDRHLRLFPGVPEFVRQLATDFPLAICSGARRHEIEYVLKKCDLRSSFRVIVSADDGHLGKPDPAGYLATLDALGRQGHELGGLAARECLAIEDAPKGVQAAHAAGMRCLAVANSQPRKELEQAELVVASLEHVSKGDILCLFQTEGR